MSLLEQNIRRKVFLGQDGNSLVFLIVFNVIIYILLSFINIVYLTNNSTEAVFHEQVLNWVSVPAEPATFATRPWTLLIYMFSHINIWELVSSMVWLWGFGFIMQDLTGNNKLIPVYLYSGFVGAIFYLLTVNLIPTLRENVSNTEPLLGAGPALMGLAVAVTTFAPRYRLFSRINLPLWVITAVFVLIRLGTIDYGNWGYVAALVTGGVMGYVFIWQLQKGSDWGQWMTDLVNWADDLFNPEKKHVKVQPKNQLYYKASQKPYEKTPHVTQQRIDDLLDKINYKGYHSLTEDEKDFLRKASQEEL